VESLLSEFIWWEGFVTDGILAKFYVKSVESPATRTRRRMKKKTDAVGVFYGAAFAV